MTTKTRILTNPEDIDCPDGIINEWLDQWNRGNTKPVTLEDLDDITYDFIYRAVDYGANQELCKAVEVVLKAEKGGEEMATELLNTRRPLESSPHQQVLNEMEVFKAFVIAEMSRLEDRLRSMNNVSA
jgi:hypothetical protein